MLIKNGRVFYNGGFVEKEILVINGKIAKVANRINESGNEDDEITDARGLVVLPGLVDLHVHLREPGFEYKEDFRTGTRAAVAGGLVYVFDMPNNKISVTTAALLREKTELARQKAICKVGFYLGAAKGNEREWKKLAGESSFAGLKIYMGQTTGSLVVDDEKTLEAHFADFDSRRPIVVHAEDQKTIEREGRTEAAALAAVEKAAGLAKKYSKKLHVAHATTASEIKLAKKTYARATVETCPHYLFISEKEFSSLGHLAGVNPPVRRDRTRRELWKALDLVDCLSTDHAPHTLEDKKNGANGYPGLETSLALMLNAYNKRLIPLETIPKMMAESPAWIVGLVKNGTIKPGMNGDLTIVDLKKEWTVRGEELETKCRWSPFEGRRLKGKNAKTIIDGKVVFDEGEVRT